MSQAVVTVRPSVNRNCSLHDEDAERHLICAAKHYQILFCFVLGGASIDTTRSLPSLQSQKQRFVPLSPQIVPVWSKYFVGRVPTPKKPIQQ